MSVFLFLCLAATPFQSTSTLQVGYTSVSIHLYLHSLIYLGSIAALDFFSPLKPFAESMHLKRYRLTFVLLVSLPFWALQSDYILSCGNATQGSHDKCVLVTVGLWGWLLKSGKYLISCVITGSGSASRLRKQCTHILDSILHYSFANVCKYLAWLS